MSARILVVDDIIPNIKLLAAKLAHEYYTVQTAGSGQEALEKIRQSPPDAVLLDVMMPGMDGFEVCRRIRENPLTHHIPVIMVTALSDAADRVKGLEAGADDFLTKPIQDTALFARIRSLVRLKMTLDEWSLRESTSGHLGLSESTYNPALETGRKGAVLLVNNRPVDMDKTKQILSTDQHRVISYNQCCDGLDSFQYENYDVIICDVTGTEEDTLRFCSAVRSDEKTRHIPILIVSDSGNQNYINSALDMGVNDYLTRPIDPNELLARVKTQVRRRRYQEQLRINYTRNLSLALIDPLTEAFNRRYLTAHLPALLANAREKQKPFAALILDIDHFKDINDTYGHAAGDRILRDLSQRVTGTLRSFDMYVRLGGEEFLVIALDSSLTAGKAVAERLRKAVADKSFTVPGVDHLIPVTISLGLTLSLPDDTPETLLKRADNALYASKKSGRNQAQVL